MRPRVPLLVLVVSVCAALIGAIALLELTTTRAVIAVGSLWLIVALVATLYRWR